MHSKIKGNIGQLAVALKLAQLGYSVFTEEGDISKVDLIAEKDGKILRFQCKAITPKNDKLEMSLDKSGPNYSFKYEKHMFDVFGLVNLSDQRVFFIPSNILDTNSRTVTLRLTKPKNNQSTRIRMAEDYTPEKILL